MSHEVHAAMRRMERAGRTAQALDALVVACRQHVATIQRMLCEIQVLTSDGTIPTETPEQKAVVLALLVDMQASADRAFDAWRAVYMRQMR